MATHDYVISNGTGSAVRSDINGALAAIVSQNSNASAPATTYAYMSWADTTAGVMKMRNGANSAWISLYELDGTFLASDISLAAGSAAAPSLFFTGDTNTGLFSPGADTVALATAGSNRLHITSGGLVGIGTASPDTALHVSGVFDSSSAFATTNSNKGLTINSSLADATGAQYGVVFSTSQGTNNDYPVAGIMAIPVAPSSGIGGSLSFQTHTSADLTLAERARIDSSGRLLVGVSANANGGILQLSSGITFPATAVAASDANTLDDYEEGTWTPNQGSGLVVVGTFSSVGRYTKVGNLVYVNGYVLGSTSIAIAAGSILCSNLIFSPALDGCGGNCANYTVNQTAGVYAAGGSTNLYATSALTASAGIIFGFTFRV